MAARSKRRKLGNVWVSQIPEYKVYRDAFRRCTQPSHHAWKSYGGRGIGFLFKSFEDFIDHIGFRPSKNLSLERIDNNGNYEEGNVK